MSGSRSNNLRVQVDVESQFTGEKSFKSAESAALAMAKAMDAADAAARRMAGDEAAAYRQAEQAAAAAEAQVRKMAQAEIAAYRMIEQAAREKAAAEQAAYREAARAAEQAAAKQRAAMETLGPVLAAGGAVVAAGVVAAVKAYADFDAAMATVASSTHESTQNMAALREAALAAGADTAFSATEAAGAIDELAKAGVATSSILDGGLAGALSLAAAGSLGVAEAAEISATALTQFNLEGSDVGHVADLLAAGAGKAQGSVSDLGAALQQGGLVASQMGLSVEETTGVLASFASAGLIGSDAGTSLKTSLLMLANPSKKASETMAELGINAYDAQGNFVGMADLAGQLQSQLGGLTQAQRDSALATIFGSDAIRAANVLYSQGESGIQGWIEQTNDAGYAAVTAATKMDTLKGDLEKLQGSLETALIQTGSAGDDFLRGAIQSVESLVDAYNSLPEPVQAAVLGLGGTAAAAGVAGGAFLMLFPRVVETVTAVKDLAAANPKAAGTLGALGKAAGVAAIALTAIQVAGSTLPDVSDKVMSMAEATSLLATQSTGVAELDAAISGLQGSSWLSDSNGFSTLKEGLQNLADPSLSDRLSDVAFKGMSLAGLPWGEGRPERTALVEQLGAMGDGLAQLVTSGAPDRAAEQFALISTQAAAAGLSQEQLLDLMPGYRDALEKQNTDQTLAAESGDAMGTAIAGTVAPIQDAAAAIEELDDAISAALGQFFDVENATANVEASIDDMTAAVKKNGVTTDLTTEKGRANAQALQDRVSTAGDLIAAMAREGKSTEELSTKTQELKDAFVAQMTQAGFSKEAIDRYAASFDLIPAQISTLVEANTAEANQQMQDLVAKWTGKTVTVKAIMDSTGMSKSDAASASRYTGQALAASRQANGSVLDFYADGGVRENHVAQIAPGGSYRVWAEDETPGLAYIPLPRLRPLEALR